MILEAIVAAAGLVFLAVLLAGALAPLWWRGDQ